MAYDCTNQHLVIIIRYRDKSMYDRTGRRIEFNQTSQNFEKVKRIQDEDDAKWTTQVEESLPIEEGTTTGETGELQLAPLVPPTSTLLSNLTSGKDWSSVLFCLLYKPCVITCFQFPVLLLESKASHHQ